MDEEDLNVTEILGTATVDWSPLGEGFVKCYTNYELDWNVDLAKQRVAMSPYGGPVAVTFRTEQQTGVNIYTLNGNQLGTIEFEGGRLVGMGWTASENLICVFEDGSIAVYGIFGQKVYNRRLDREVNAQRVKQCRFFHTLAGQAGFAIMTYEYRFFVVSDSDQDRDSLRLNRLVELPATGTCPSCWEVLSHKSSVSVVAAVQDKLYQLTRFEAILLNVTCRKDYAPHWTAIAFSLDGEMAALIDKEGYLWMGDSDFKVMETEFDTPMQSKALQIEWSYRDFVCVVFERFMLIKGLGKHWSKLPTRGPSILLPEVDGVRILTNTSCEFLNRVNSQSLAVLRVASLKPGALVNDAFKEYQGDESHKADEYIRFIKDKLVEGVKQCLLAASEEFDPKIQQSLLMSANFGKGFLCPDIPQEIVDLFVTTCRHLRVVNTVRDPRIGIPISFRQFKRLSAGVLLDRMINRGLYPLAQEMCVYLKIPPMMGEKRVLRQWALRKIEEPFLEQREVARMILDKFKKSSNIAPFTEIARAAQQKKLIILATELLEHEILVGDQVQMLLEMEETNKALDKAISSGDAQLVYQVLEKLRNDESNTGEYLQIFNHKPMASALYKKYCKETDQEQLINMYRQESNFVCAGTQYLALSYVGQEDHERPIPNAQKLAKARSEFVDGQFLFHQKVVEDQIKLLEEQKKLHAEWKLDVVGMALFDTVVMCIRERKAKAAETLRKTFRMIDSMYWWAKLQGLVEIAEYEELERFSRQSKSPIGYEPFADICIRHRRYREAIKYIPRCAKENRCKLFMRAGYYTKAAEAAYADKDLKSLEDILTKEGSRNPDLAQQVQMMMGKLGSY